MDVCGFSMMNGMPAASASRASRAVKRAIQLPTLILSRSLSLTHLNPQGYVALLSGGGRPLRARENEVQGVAIIKAFTLPLRTAEINFLCLHRFVRS